MVENIEKKITSYEIDKRVEKAYEKNKILGFFTEKYCECIYLNYFSKRTREKMTQSVLDSVNKICK
jgi:hypothetical protein